MAENQWTIENKVVIVTGANCGIGKAAALEIAKRGAAKIILACRNLIAAEEAASDIRQQAGLEEGSEKVVVRHLDLASLASVRKFSEKILATEPVLHVLINNAGISGLPSRTVTEDGYEATFQTNHLGHFLLTNLLLDLLKKSAPSRVVIVASGAYAMTFSGLRTDDLNFERQNYGPFWAYSQSKLCNVLHARRLHQVLNGESHDSEVSVFAVHPGAVNTEIFRNNKIIKFFANRISLIWATPEDGAKTTVVCACDAGIEQFSGQYFDKGKPSDVRSCAKDDCKADELWKISEQFCTTVDPNRKQ